MKRLIILISVILLMFSLCSCDLPSTPTDTTVNNNLYWDAKEFKILRKITVYNALKDVIIFECEGYISINNNSSSELVVTVMVGEEEFKKHYIYLNDFTLYVVEDINGSHVDPYHYKFYFHKSNGLDVEVVE